MHNTHEPRIRMTPLEQAAYSVEQQQAVVNHAKARLRAEQRELRARRTHLADLRKRGVR